VLTDGYDQNAFAHVARVCDLPGGPDFFREPTGKKADKDQRGHASHDGEPASLEQSLPPARAFFREPRRQLLPNASLEVVARIRHGHGVQRGVHRLDLLKLVAAFGTFMQMGGDSVALLGIAIPISN